MASISVDNTPTLNGTQTIKPQIQPVSTETQQASQQIESSTVTISEEGKALLNALSKTNEGKALLHALSEIDSASQTESTEEINNHLASFAHGALGIDNPDEASKEEKDTSYTAGQYFKGALTVGSILLAIV